MSNEKLKCLTALVLQGATTTIKLRTGKFLRSSYNSKDLSFYFYFTFIKTLKL